MAWRGRALAAAGKARAAAELSRRELPHLALPGPRARSLVSTPAAPLVGNRAVTLLGPRAATLVGPCARSLVGTPAAPLVGNRAVTLLGPRAATLLGPCARSLVGTPSAPLVGTRAVTLVGLRAASLVDPPAPSLVGLRAAPLVDPPAPSLVGLRAPLVGTRAPPLVATGAPLVRTPAAPRVGTRAASLVGLLEPLVRTPAAPLVGLREPLFRTPAAPRVGTRGSPLVGLHHVLPLVRPRSPLPTAVFSTSAGGELVDELSGGKSGECKNSGDIIKNSGGDQVAVNVGANMPGPLSDVKDDVNDDEPIHGDKNDVEVDATAINQAIKSEVSNKPQSSCECDCAERIERLERIIGCQLKEETEINKIGRWNQTAIILVGVLIELVVVFVLAVIYGSAYVARKVQAHAEGLKGKLSPRRVLAGAGRTAGRTASAVWGWLAFWRRWKQVVEVDKKEDKLDEFRYNDFWRCLSE